jgi:hypothetical protein
MCGGTPRQSLLGGSDYRLLCCPRPYAYGGSGLEQERHQRKNASKRFQFNCRRGQKIPQISSRWTGRGGQYWAIEPARIDPRRSTNHLMIRTCAKPPRSQNCSSIRASSRNRSSCRRSQRSRRRISGCSTQRRSEIWKSGWLFQKTSRWRS